MILYIEKSVVSERQTKIILEKNPWAKVLIIDNYKNIFDKQISGTQEKSLIVAKVNNAVLKAPLWYGFSWPWYFLKTSLNCIFKCDYCYLQGIFKSDISVIFVNYEYIKNQILETLSQYKDNGIVWFYSSDYSDNLAIDWITNFSQEFIPFFGALANAKMEIRTKSNNINNLLYLNASNNIEIAFYSTLKKLLMHMKRGRVL